jgi:predicted amidohydrolase
MRAAAIQLNSNADKDRNLETAERLVREAAGAGAELIVLPEKWNVLGGPDALAEGAEELDGPTTTAVRGWAGELGVAIVAGSIAERVAGEERLYNTSCLIDAGGEVVARYRTSSRARRSSPRPPPGSSSGSRSATTSASPSSTGSSPSAARA